MLKQKEVKHDSPGGNPGAFSSDGSLKDLAAKANDLDALIKLGEAASSPPTTEFSPTGKPGHWVEEICCDMVHRKWVDY